MNLTPIPARSRGTRGFTLIELTVSASLMALILVAAYVCLNAGISAQRMLDPRLESTQYARVALALMTADLRTACPLEPDREFIGMDRTLGAVEADNLDFATLNHTPRRAGEGDYCQASYYVDQDRETGEFILWRRRNPRLGPDPFSGGAREEIARGIRQLKFEYFDGFEWYDTWGDVEGRGKEATSNRLRSNLSGLPVAVRITLAFAPGWRPANPADASADPARRGEPPMIFQTVVRIQVPTMSLAGGTPGSSPSPGAANDGQAPSSETR